VTAIGAVELGGVTGAVVVPDAVVSVASDAVSVDDGAGAAAAVSVVIVLVFSFSFR
jgi:hypothetical protein